MRTSRNLSIAVAVGLAAATIGVSGGNAGLGQSCSTGETALANQLIEKVSGPGTTPTLTACYNAARSSIYFRTYNLGVVSGNPEDISGLGVTNDTVLRISADLPAQASSFNSIITGWATSVTRSGNRVTIVGSPRPNSYAPNCMIDSCSAETAQYTWQSYFMAQLDLPGAVPADYFEKIAGSWVATGANSFSVSPTMVTADGAACAMGAGATCAPSLSIAMAGPHLQADGQLNPAHFAAFMPTSMITSYMGFGSLGAADLDLVRREAGASAGSEVNGMRCNPVADGSGMLCVYDVPGAHFSAPTYAIRAAKASSGSGGGGGSASPVKPRPLAGAWRIKKGKGTTSGTLPTGATSVSQVATTGGSAATQGFLEMARAKTVRGKCAVKAVRNKKTKKVTKRTYSCSITLGKGAWTVTTTARGPAGVVAEGSRAVTVR